MRAPDQLRADILFAYYRARKEAERQAARGGAAFVHIVSAILEKQRRQAGPVS